jgi:predicted CoA-binding protein
MCTGATAGTQREPVLRARRRGDWPTIVEGRAMKHRDADEALMQAVLRESRTIAVIGASPEPDRHSYTVVGYLHDAGYDVIPVRPDRATVDGLPTYASLADAGGRIDMAVILRRPDAVPGHIEQAAAKGVRCVWLEPGTSSRPAEETARRLRLAIVKDHCIIDAHKHLAGALGESPAGHPEEIGVHVGRRRRDTH